MLADGHQCKVLVSLPVAKRCLRLTTCTHTCTHTCTRICTRICTRMHTHAHTHAHTCTHTHAHDTHVGLDESDGAEDTVGRARLAEASEIRHLDNHVVVEANVTARSGSVVLVHKYNGPGGQFQEERNQHMRVQPCAQPKERQHRVEVGL